MLSCCYYGTTCLLDLDVVVGLDSGRRLDVKGRHTSGRITSSPSLRQQNSSFFVVRLTWFSTLYVGHQTLTSTLWTLGEMLSCIYYWTTCLVDLDVVVGLDFEGRLTSGRGLVPQPLEERGM